MNGARRIFLYNWPVYVGTWLAAVLVLAVAPRLGALSGLLAVGAATAIAWSVCSLAVSHYVYDRSPLVAGEWVRGLLPANVAAWVAIDAGLDAEVALDAVMPGKCIARLDLYDGDVVRAPSVQRARATTTRVHRATAIKATSLPLASGSCDVVAVVFSAHEVHRAANRDTFFVELARVLRPGGRLLLVEHVRDLANFAAFGPGFLHFAPRAEWMRLARHAGLAVAVEQRVTPWVMALALEKRA